jgi:hypothetical protein
VLPLLLERKGRRSLPCCHRSNATACAKTCGDGLLAILFMSIGSRRVLWLALREPSILSAVRRPLRCSFLQMPMARAGVSSPAAILVSHV